MHCIAIVAWLKNFPITIQSCNSVTSKNAKFIEILASWYWGYALL